MRLLDSCKLHKRRGKWTLMVYAGTVHALEVNESFALLWQQFDGQEFTQDDIASFLVSAFELEEAEAPEQAALVIDLWKEQHLLVP